MTDTGTLESKTPTYRAIIDKVVNGVRPDFEENGIEEAVLVHLQQASLRISSDVWAFRSWSV